MMPRLPAKAKKLNARAWVFGVLFSVVMARMVLFTLSALLSRVAWSLALIVEAGGQSWEELVEVTYTTVPEKTPARHLKNIICHIFWERPNKVMEMATPVNEKTRTGFLPILSAARPQDIIRSICVNEKRDSYGQK